MKTQRHLDNLGVFHVAAEMRSAREKHGPKASAHEAYAVILEEVEEFWDEVKKKSQARCHANMATELVQIAAAALLALTDLDLIAKAGDGWRSPPSPTEEPASA